MEQRNGTEDISRMKWQIITLIGLAISFLQDCSFINSKKINNDIFIISDRAFVGKSVGIACDTAYPVPIKDSAQIKTFVNTLRSKVISQESFNSFNIDDAEYYLLKKNLIVKCILSGPTGWSSNFYHYFIIDTINYKSIYFRSLSDNMSNIKLNKDLFVNSVEYSDRFFSDVDLFDKYFDGEFAVFKVIYRKISATTLDPISIIEKDTTLRWNKVYKLQITQNN